MKSIAVPIILLGYVFTISCETQQSLPDYGHKSSSVLSGIDDMTYNLIEKRPERYAFGLGRRAYTYTSGGSGVKRLPVYNFGLGKRARPYGFGLGKRTQDDDPDSYQNYDIPMDLSYFDNHNKNSEASEKRARPYSFGLGKRLYSSDDNEVDRRQERLYNFGLGRR
ncbi:allatostatin-A [Bradysia coprophila]|uniref:allatostatin-A n=1 Tax=Bradysia coprophila TaxID=38358 RepID=UPI00187D7B0F|nr:allatostatin-A [Bradysia coprophila]XP_037027153.1 allatostatin-A [Bradysia coprophila]